MNWLERARREIRETAPRRTAKSAERTLTAVMAVPSPALRQKLDGSIGSNGSAPTQRISKKEDGREDFEERAAIIEYDAGAPRAWAEALARLDVNRPPGDVPLERWRRFIDDCGRFLDEGWAAHAIAIGWGPLDLFGCDRDRPFTRVEHAGLLWLLGGDKLTDLRRDRAVIERPNGISHAYRHRPNDLGQVVLAWELGR